MTHYSELSPTMDDLTKWSVRSSQLPTQEAEILREDLLVLYRKAKIADLTGVERQNQKAKFIYDLSQQVCSTPSYYRDTSDKLTSLCL